jgi:hypothetical protein
VSELQAAELGQTGGNTQDREAEEEGAGKEKGEEWTMTAFLSAHYALDAKK